MARADSTWKVPVSAAACCDVNPAAPARRGGVCKSRARINGVQTLISTTVAQVSCYEFLHSHVKQRSSGAIHRDRAVSENTFTLTSESYQI